MTAERTKNEPSFALVTPTSLRADTEGITVELDVITNNPEFAERAVADFAERTGAEIAGEDPRTSTNSRSSSHAVSNWSNCGWEPSGEAWDGKAGSKKFVN